MFRRMSMTIALILCVIAAMLAGVIGVLLGGRGGAVLKAERDAQTESFRKAIRDLEAEIAERKRLQDERDAVRLQLAAHESAQAARDEAHASQLAELRANRESLEAQFKALSAQMLEAAQSQFLDRAEARFRQSEATSGDALKALLAPVESTLKRYEEGLKSVEKDRVDSYASLREAVEQVKQGQGQVRDETARLVNVLRSSPKARGRWGEQQLRNVLEMAGLSEHADFQTEVSVEGDEGRQLRPDVIVRLPGGKQLIIDAKCALNAYLDASEATDDVARKAHLTAHTLAIRNHAQQLGAKSYWSQFGDAADYVVMFIPGEHFLSAALEQDHGLWEWAFERKVLLATPTNLIAIARTVSAVWRQEKLAVEAQTIAALGKELHARLQTMGSHVVKLGRNLELATGAYNAFVGSLESQVLTQAKRFETLEVAGGSKSIEDLAMIDVTPRPLIKLVASD
jgi:DNA recombination protein RmuC